MFAEDDLLPLSGLQHLAFCERQWALIHLEGVWAENRLTVEGRQLHERVHENAIEVRAGVRVARGLRIHTFRLGLAGQADVVEFHPLLSAERSSIRGTPLPGVEGLWRPFPVEYKRGRAKAADCDEVQLCAQALCLEEMLGACVPAGALFYGLPRRRTDIAFDLNLRARTEALAIRLHELYGLRHTPRAAYEKKCESCSLLESCLPRAIGLRRSAERHLVGAIAEALGGQSET